MILVDSSIWADHIHHPVAQLSEFLRQQRVVMHPFVIGEIILGNLASRDSTSWALRQLDSAPSADDAEVFSLIENAKLFGTGIGYVDAHLLASTLLIPSGLFWTRDKRLLAVAKRLQIDLR